MRQDTSRIGQTVENRPKGRFSISLFDVCKIVDEAYSVNLFCFFHKSSHVFSDFFEFGMVQIMGAFHEDDFSMH